MSSMYIDRMPEHRLSLSAERLHARYRRGSMSKRGLGGRARGVLNLPQCAVLADRLEIRCWGGLGRHWPLQPQQLS